MIVNKIGAIDFYTLHNILTSNKITESQKSHFLIQNKVEIERFARNNLTASEFAAIMKNRPLVKFQLIRNSFKKRGDKILLANALEIDPGDVDGYISDVTEELKELNQLKFLQKDKFDTLKTYIYRHGSKSQLVDFLDLELIKADDKIKTIYSTLEYHTGGMADYFIRPIHRMDNKTLVKLYNVIDKHIKAEQDLGNISEADSEKVGKWALIQLYQLKNNSQLINAIKTYKTLKQ